MRPDTAIGTNAGLPWDRCTIHQEAEALGDHVGNQPDAVLGVPSCAAGKQERPRCSGRCWQTERDHGSLPGGDGSRLGEKLHSRESGQAVFRHPVSHADKLISVPAGEALCAVLLWTVLLGHAQTLERLFCLLHAASTTDVLGEA